MMAPSAKVYPAWLDWLIQDQRLCPSTYHLGEFQGQFQDTDISVDYCVMAFMEEIQSLGHISKH